MGDKNLIGKLIKASNKISKNRKPSANYIHLNEVYIQQLADEREITFDEMVEIMKTEVRPNE
jgi:hypothetical protein